MIFAIDPGPTESAYCHIGDDYRPIDFGKVPNERMPAILVNRNCGRVAIEWIESYGMPVGAEVFETVFWIGRFTQHLYDLAWDVDRIPRRAVKLHLCQSSRAGDGNIVQALVDRFASGERNRGKGIKSAPGWFFGFAGDVWQAYALGVYVADREATAA